ncbi:alpha-2-macroglobulin family protein [Mucilaginibacter sp.]|uniref:alpha-2-macroglobulin family protein n=1 Tax=Mucilaginibacter sp. TaxID=1882438 RepID=UPI003B0015FD
MFSKCFFYRIKSVITVGLLFFLAGNVFAQQKFGRLINKIDSLTAAGLPKSALKEVDKLDLLARQNHNAPQQIRAAVYRMNLQTYLEENALIAIINRLKLDIKRAEFPVKPVLQSVLAEIFWKYYGQNRYQFSQRSTLEKPDADFTKWDLKTIIREVGNLYQQSLQNTQLSQNTSVSVLEGVLQGDKSTRYLRPTLYDLLLHRALDFYLAEEPDLPKPRLAFSLNDPRFFGDDAVFIHLKLAKTDTASVTYQGIKLLQQATIFHLQKKHLEALADLDLKRFEFLHRKSTLPEKDLLYKNALQNSSQIFVNQTIAADGLVLLAQYFRQKDSLVTAVGYLQKAIKTYPESLGGKNAVLLLQQINQQSLSAEIENVNLPDEPVLAKVNYQNLQNATATIYQLNDKQLTEARHLQQYNNSGELNFNPKILAYVQRLPVVQQQQIRLPDLKDYRQHAAEFKIHPLKPGFYVLLLSAENRRDSSLTGVSGFQVTNLAYVGRQNPDESLEIKTINRKTGELMKNVKVKVVNTQEGTIVGNGLSDTDGKFVFHTIRNNSLKISLSVPGDFYTDNNSFYGAIDRQEKYSSKQTILFTDRQLYRPGQTIYFKGLQLVNKNGKSEIVVDEEQEVELNDSNNKKLSSVKIKTNQFGTFSGSFVLPQSMLNGQVYLRTENGDLNVRIEEYKRPTFQLIFNVVKEAYRPGDSVKLKGKVLAFSGFGLAGARVKVDIKSSRVEISKQPNSNRINSINITKKSTDFLSDTITTNAKGEFVIRFKAFSDPNLELSSFYNIQAEATNSSGETHVNSVSLNVATNPLKINLNLPQKLLQTDSLQFQAGLMNLNNQFQTGSLNVKIFSLKKPDQTITKNRLWEKPDQFLWTKDEFKKLFPTYAWKNEDEPRTWEKDKLVSETDLKADSNRFSILDLSGLKQENSGFYRIEIAAKNSIGDTISTIQLVQFINQKPEMATMENWAVPLVVQAAPGSKVSFSLMPEIHVLAEVFDGEKILSSEWIATGKTMLRKEISVPMNASNKLHVQFLMLKDNRVYNLYQRINIIRNEHPLSVKLLTFRDKLQPGEKEQWKLQVSGNEKQSVEMLAAMYDASLDDLAPAQNWMQQLQNINREYDANYFSWNIYNFINAKQTQQLYFRSTNFDLLVREYEKLNLLGFNYYGGYNYAFQHLTSTLANELATNAMMVQINKDNYQKSVAAYKNGFDVNGRIIDAKDKIGLAIVTVTIKGTKIYVYTDNSGRFKLHIPENATLIIGYIGYIRQEIRVKKGVLPVIKLKPSNNSLNEVVVVGYGTQAKRSLTSSMTFVEESNELISFAAVEKISADGTIIRNGKVVQQNVMIRGRSSLEGKVAGLQIADANSNGLSASNPILIRKNFNETAFFYPQLSTNEKGEILINFTMPEALTKWRFKALAQTPELKFAYQEKEVITQKQLMVSANMPRFFREGDTIVVSAIVANLDTKKVVVKTVLQLFNAMNMQPVKLLANASEGNQTIDIEANTNKSVSFKLIIPQGLDALNYRLTADAGKYSDGEENTIPVLPNAMLVTESVPMMVRPNQTKTFTLEKLLHNQSSTLQNKTLTLEYTENPAWYAVQALPYLMEYPYECAEQTFSRYFANSLATSLLKRLPVIQQVFERWKTSDSKELLSNLEKNQELKSVLIEETPWLRDAQNESEQKKRIALLFDLNKMSYELQRNIDKLKEMQLADGSFPWFTGLHSDRYITQYILAGIGQLYNAKAVGLQNQTLKNISDKALNYLDQELVKPRDAVFIGKKLVPDNLSSIEIHGWYARSYFAEKPMSDALKAAWKKYQQKANTTWTQRSVYEKGLIALTFQHFKLVKEAQQIVKSLIETSQQSEEMGMYWPKNQLGYFWYQNPVETQSLLIELFAEAGKSKEAEEMKIWLLRNKQTNNWKTTTATAQACYALLLHGENWLQPKGKTMLFLGGKNLQELKPEIKADAGTGYFKTSWNENQIKPELGKIEVKNGSNVISWGAIYWQYLEKLDKISSAKNSISLERKYFIRSKNNAGEVLIAVDKNHHPKVGDLLKIVVYLKTDRDFEYVHLKDMRPAGTEPVDVLSAYKYQDGLQYYQVTKDVATNFFISYLSKGNYVFEYGLRVAQPGNFSTGISSVQSMYAPEFGAHSEGKRITLSK